jgi:hypothetical protein
MNLFSLLMYAIFFPFFLLMSVPSIVACYVYWFRGGNLLSERLDAHFRSFAMNHAHRRRKLSKRDSCMPYIQPKSITDQPTYSSRTYDAIERR